MNEVMGQKHYTGVRALPPSYTTTPTEGHPSYQATLQDAPR